jgi:signal peptidase I|mmetsp:Transcript_51521/g.129252  ORF Transcript_51521/g.129252 Transcript_51521/m.129252 type:complete len:270 (+) Transcript_51521:359-1168(+)
MSTKSPRPAVLWVHPRSCSTAFERVMMERGDLKILHEPFGYVYYVHEARTEVPFFYVDPNHPTAYPDVRDMILNTDPSAEGKTRTYFKDMPFHCFDHIMKDEDFIRSVDHTFLVRDPAKGIVSHYAINNSVTRQEIGYDAQSRLFDRILEVTGKAPAVVDADDFQADTEGVVAAYCQYLGLSFDEKCLTWQPGMVKEWEAWKEWHAEAARSSGIRPPTSNEKQMKVIKEHPHLQEYYDYHLPFYQKLIKHKLTRESASAVFAAAHTTSS